MNTHQKLALAVVGSALHLTVPPLMAQDDAAAVVSPAQSLVEALERTSKTGATMTGKVTDKTESNADGAFGMMIISGMGGNKGKKFEGAFEAQTRGRRSFVCTQRKLPGVAIMTNGNTTLIRKTEEAKAAVDATPLTEDVLRFLDLGRIAREVARAEKKTTESRRKEYAITVKTSEDGAQTIDVPLRKNTLPAPDDGRLNIMLAKILEIRAVFVVAPEGTLQSMTFTVTRSDPMAAIRKRAMEGGGRIEISDPSDLADDDPEEGTKTEYAFRFQTSEMSPRAKRLSAELDALFEL